MKSYTRLRARRMEPRWARQNNGSPAERQPPPGGLVHSQEHGHGQPVVEQEPFGFFARASAAAGQQPVVESRRQRKRKRQQQWKRWHGRRARQQQLAWSDGRWLGTQPVERIGQQRHGHGGSGAAR